MELLGITPEPHFVRQPLGWPQVDTGPSPHSGEWGLTVVPGEGPPAMQPSAAVFVLKSITVTWCHWAQVYYCYMVSLSPSLVMLYGVTEPSCECVCVCVNQRGPSVPWSLTSSFLFLTTFQSKIIIFLSPTLDSYSLLGSTIGKKISSFCCPCIIPVHHPDPVFQGGSWAMVETWRVMYFNITLKVACA